MRGKLNPRLAAVAAKGNIPAYAGKTRTDQAGGVKRAEHPRVCGENRHRFTNAAAEHGTSPRMRGKPVR